jgi:hypothetical protein
MNISDYRRDFAAYSAAIELAHYEHRAGFQPELRTEPIYERYGELFTRENIRALKQAESETPPHLETERAGLRALYHAACIGFLEAEARELTDERSRCESLARVEWDGEKIPLNSVQRLLTNEPDATRRHELTSRWSDALTACDDLRAARFESFHAAARSLGFDSYGALFSEVMGTDLSELARRTDALLDQTAQAYMSELAHATARDLPGVRFEDLHYADYNFFQRYTRLDQFFPASEALPTYGAGMRSLGIRVEQQQNIHIDDEPRPQKNPRAACFRIHPPDDVRLLLAPVGGVYDYTTLFHEGGHAQHFAWSSRELFERHPEFVYAPDHATTEGYAFLLSHLFRDELWLGEHRNISSAARAREIKRDIALVTVHQIRRLCGKLRYELMLHSTPQPQSEQLAQGYAELLTEATSFRRTPALYLTDVDDGFYSAAYLRALAFEVSLREHLRTRWGRRWWANPKAGDELIDLWNTASRYSTEELARLIGFGEISFELLAENLIEDLKRD